MPSREVAGLLDEQEHVCTNFRRNVSLVQNRRIQYFVRMILGGGANDEWANIIGF